MPKPTAQNMIPEAHLTAFALDDTEHLSADALKAVHDAYETDTDVRAEIDAIRSTTALLGESWQGELSNTDALGIGSTNQPTESLKFPGFFIRNKRLWLPTGLAAAAAIGMATLLLPPVLSDAPERDRQLGSAPANKPLNEAQTELAPDTLNAAASGSLMQSKQPEAPYSVIAKDPTSYRMASDSDKASGEEQVPGTVYDQLLSVQRMAEEKDSNPLHGSIGFEILTDQPDKTSPGLEANPTDYLLPSELKDDVSSSNQKRVDQSVASGILPKLGSASTPPTVVNESMPKRSVELEQQQLATGRVNTRMDQPTRPRGANVQDGYASAGRTVGQILDLDAASRSALSPPSNSRRLAVNEGRDAQLALGVTRRKVERSFTGTYFGGIPAPTTASDRPQLALGDGSTLKQLRDTESLGLVSRHSNAPQRDRESRSESIQPTNRYYFNYHQKMDQSLGAEKENRYGDALQLNNEAWGYIQQHTEQFGTEQAEELGEQVRRRSINLSKKLAEAERYAALVDQPFHRPTEQALSTFSIDVDTASYANARRFIENGALPPKDSVRIEEFINAFDYHYAETVVDAVTGDTPPFTSAIETASCPWNENHRLMRIGIKGVEVDPGERPIANLVFLIDVSGSMRDSNKLALVKKGLIMLTESLNPSDRVSIVTYASGTSVALPSTSANEPGKIIDTINNLSAGGSTNGAGGLELAYAEARKQSAPGMINRVILCTDGDFNVGQSSTEGLTDMVKQNANTPSGDNVTVSVFGFGTGNLNDAMLESITNNGNGIYSYIPDEQEAQTQFVDGLTGQLFTIAKDVKVQVEFNPTQVAGYRLIGYANRMLKAEDFNNDRVDAGDIGAGHTVTALYEVIPTGLPVPGPDGGSVDALRYQTSENDKSAPDLKPEAAGNELAFVKVRYKHPSAKAEPGTSKLLTFPVKNTNTNWTDATPDFRFAAAVAAFGETLRESPNRGSANLDLVLTLADEDAITNNENRQGFRQLIEKAKQITGATSAPTE